MEVLKDVSVVARKARTLRARKHKLKTRIAHDNERRQAAPKSVESILQRADLTFPPVVAPHKPPDGDAKGEEQHAVEHHSPAEGHKFIQEASLKHLRVHHCVDDNRAKTEQATEPNLFVISNHRFNLPIRWLGRT